jgi:hypothetical protein
MKQILQSFAVRVVGVFMAFFITGAGIGATSPVGWLWGGLLAVGTVLSTIITVLGVILIWKAEWTLQDIEKTFRSVVAQQDDEAIKSALNIAEQDSFDFSDIGDLSELDDPKA